MGLITFIRQLKEETTPSVSNHNNKATTTLLVFSSVVGGGGRCRRHHVVGGESMISSSELQALRSFMAARSSDGILPNLFALLEAASYVAEQAVSAEERGRQFLKVGHIGQIVDEVNFYAHAAHLHGVQLIGEVGFNAGHSAVAMLFQSHNSFLVSFDIGDVPWAQQSLAFVQRIFPGRVERVTGNSTDTLARFASEDRRKFDLISIDGWHDGEVPYQDMLNGRDASRPGGYVLIDDHSDSFPDVMLAWARAKSEGWITEIVCADKNQVVDGFHKAYCLGLYSG